MRGGVQQGSEVVHDNVGLARRDGAAPDPFPPSLDFLLSYLLGEGGVHWHQIMNYFELNCQIPRILYS